MMTKRQLQTHVTDKFKQLRKIRGWTQATLAKKAGLARTTITQLECGYFLPELHTTYSLAGAFEITLDELVK